MPQGSLVRLAYYPFLPEVRGALHELLSVPVARMLVVALGEKVLVQRYAGAEARRAAAVLAGDGDPEAVDRCAHALGLPLLPVEAGWRLHVSEYLRAAPLHDADWKLIRRPLDRGNVTVDRDDAVRLVQEALQRRIVEELEAERGKPMPEPVKQALAPLLARLAPRLEEARESWTTGDFGPVQPGLFPPCVKELFAAMGRAEMVPHHGRFAFATFLGTIGWNSEQIMDYMSTLPNFDREKSRYQIEHVTGQRGVDKYTPPGCGTMQTNGVCPLDKRDGLCFKVKHPLSYYRAKLRFAANDAARAGPTKPATESREPKEPPTGSLGSVDPGSPGSVDAGFLGSVDSVARPGAGP